MIPDVMNEPFADHNADTAAGGQRAAGVTRAEVLQQLERLERSPHFRNSKRYPALLRYVVEHVLSGQADQLKERTLGVEVFGRRADYDTSTDPVVRFTAGEIRKRIAQYYLMPEHEHELRFELPLGSYVPHFAWHTAHPPREHDATGDRTHGDPSRSNEAHNNEAHSNEAPSDDHRHATAERKRTAAPMEQHGNVLAPLHAPDAAGARGQFASEAPALSHALPPASPAQLPSSTAATTQRRPWLRSWYLWTAVLLLAVAAAAMAGWRWWLSDGNDAAHTALWQPLLAGTEPCLIVLGVHSFDTAGNDLSPAISAEAQDKQSSMLNEMLRSQMVPITDVLSYGKLTSLLARSGHAFVTRSAEETNFNQLRAQPVVLLGGFNNPWTMRLTAGLRFRLQPGSGSVHTIVDSRNPGRQWQFDSAQSAGSTSEDFGIVASVYDRSIDQRVMLIAGIGKDGTEAATEFITDAAAIHAWLKTQPRSHSNYEVVLSTEIIDGHHGPAHVADSSSW